MSYENNNINPNICDTGLFRKNDTYSSLCILEAKYNKVKIPDAYYPSCYRQNVLVMLAKRLLSDENNQETYCKNNTNLHKKFLKRIASKY